MTDPLSGLMREAFKRRPEPVCVVTAANEFGDLVGMTATAVMSVSLDPPLVLVSLRSQSLLACTLNGGTDFLVHILGAAQEELAMTMASPLADKFARVPHRISASGAPRLQGCVAVLNCEKEVTYRAGDHVLIIARVGKVELEADGDPSALIYHLGQFGSVRADAPA